ncbi:restriction endonuclease subunit S [Leeuwenhoekiella marinoflava]|uniref:restriction endonuclease subunit S n=1 Tax=Leeuwenhoekiella marinoflava TaxID=988 RepID=UPI003001ABBA
MKVNQIASVSSGINNRRNPQGSVYYLGASDFSDARTLNPLLKPSLMASPKLEKHYLNTSDVLVLAKGHHGFTAHTVAGDFQPAVASSVFLVLRKIATTVLPEYLVWYINLKSTQEELKGYGRGSALPAINRTILGDLEINIPDIEMQKNIVNLDKLKKNESILVKQLDSLKTTQLELLLKTKIQNNEQ